VRPRREKQQQQGQLLHYRACSLQRQLALLRVCCSWLCKAVSGNCRRITRENELKERALVSGARVHDKQSVALSNVLLVVTVLFAAPVLSLVPAAAAAAAVRRNGV
jgi:hypothetical protein